MSDSAWGWEWVGPGRKRRKLTPQQRALKQRHKAGLRMAKPAETRQRVEFIATLMRGDHWYGKVSVARCAQDWSISISRVEQLAAEAKRMVQRG